MIPKAEEREKEEERETGLKMEKEAEEGISVAAI